ncbi:MAG TPA: YbaB/EbfC family nucleoid-associated protein [Candidatus Hydrogenedentes bacterium]|nr:YbaB/EbfC family nucleoid-associated protein [Candidatus Hydrogenedentota bacterium]HOL75632.1 YbaB/EbfC family nucleoid-associated protein [Candidatus Hydrogenedentota bacterium]HPO84375.1 YbaB/EbfC family nucleoid-associated protein [Candidatus Hydrogenedentota bacterium]
MLPKGLGNLGNLTGMLKQAMDLKARVEELKTQLGELTIEASAGGGMVVVVMTGRFEVISIHIDPEIIDQNDPETLETLVKAAINEAVRKVQEIVENKMREITGGLDIPGLTT